MIPYQVLNLPINESCSVAPNVPMERKDLYFIHFYQPNVLTGHFLFRPHRGVSLVEKKYM
jgi:hypothetical protein